MTPNGRRNGSEYGGRRPGVVFHPTAARALRAGAGQIVAAVRPTLGPTPRLVAVARPNGDSPELLDSGAVIARRIVALTDRDADVGAMLARAVIWKTQEAAGDGTATAAVLFQALLDGGLRLVAAGFAPDVIRRCLERAGEATIAAMEAQGSPISGREQLTCVATTVCPDQPVARLLGEIFDVIGADGQLDVRSGTRRDCEREYVEGMHWPGGVHSALFIADAPERRTVVEECGILISDLDLTEPSDVLVIVERARAAQLKSLVILAQRLSDRAIGALLAIQHAAGFRAIAVKSPGTGETERVVAMRDLALLTGGQPLARAAGDRAASVTAEVFGRARIAWADRDHFGIVGGQGDPRALRRHVAALRAAFRAEPDHERREVLRERLGKLLGGSATLWIGGATEAEIATRKSAAERAAHVLRGAVAAGVVPGGGTAFLACRDVLRCRRSASNDECERAALRVAIRALEEPTRTLIANAGRDAEPAIARLEAAGSGHVFDALTARVMPATEAGLLDPVAVATAAMRAAFGGAAQALTIDVLVHHRTPEIATRPG